MAGVSAFKVNPVQEVKARNLQTLMAVLDEISGGTGHSADHATRLAPGSLADAAGRLRAALAAADAPRLATVLLAPHGNRLTISLGGMPLEVILPDALVSAAKANPGLLARGTNLQVEVDAQTGVLRLSLPAPALPAITAATIRTISQNGTGPSASPAPPLADFFPPGSPGSLIQKLAQLHLPLAERGDASPSGGTAAQPSGSRGIGPSAPATLPPALLEASLKAAMRQMPLGSALSALLSGKTDGVDPALLASLRAMRIDGFAKPDAASIEQALQQSGLFLEGRLAALAQGAGGSLPHDLKSLLNLVRASLGAGADATAGPEMPTPRGPDLARLVEGGVERIKLQQIASLPDHPGMTVTDDRAQSSRLAFQIPLATHGQERPETAMIGVMIEHDPRPDLPPGILVEDEGGEGSEAFPWKVRIALDLEETGPVQAEIALRGQRVGVTLWAERKAMAEDARRAIGDLHAALTGAAFEVAHLDVKDGRPAGPIHRPSAHLDRRS
ncbi:MAG: flagellar hook-length control protein FliK [Methylobacterium sp.]|nr:flagellar hook-length control protein FliK [Methylobacterium sp.]